MYVPDGGGSGGFSVNPVALEAAAARCGELGATWRSDAVRVQHLLRTAAAAACGPVGAAADSAAESASDSLHGLAQHLDLVGVALHLTAGNYRRTDTGVGAQLGRP